MEKQQHEKIVGYRKLTDDEIALMNEAKALGEAVGSLIARLRKLEYKTQSMVPQDPSADTSITVADQRCVAIAATDLQTGFMWLSRAIAKPTTF